MMHRLLSFLLTSVLIALGVTGSPRSFSTAIAAYSTTGPLDSIPRSAFKAPNPAIEVVADPVSRRGAPCACIFTRRRFLPRGKRFAEGRAGVLKRDEHRKR